ncbi:MAG: hypothetical protein IJU50_06375, partial [Lachnospiraceae bacterium]|nr:hypothetical protein [Lachnospiraceae bacterium]
MEKGFHLRKSNYVIGIDLSFECVQISYYEKGEKPQSVSTVPGSELYQIPLALYKPKEDNWLFGREAIRKAEEEGKLPYRDLLRYVYLRKFFLVDGEQMPAIELLALFLRRVLSLLPGRYSLSGAGVLSITAEKLDKDKAAALSGLEGKLKADVPLFILDRKEALFSYIAGQPKSVRSGEALALSFREKNLQVFRFSLNQDTFPPMGRVFLDAQPFVIGGEEEFCRILAKYLTLGDFQSVFLIGEGPFGEWGKESLTLLCQGRRVFRGSNLFCLGAAFHALGKLTEEEGAAVYLGEDALLASVSLGALERDRAGMAKLLPLGIQASEASWVSELYLDETRTLDFQISRLDGSIVIKRMVFSGIPERPGFSTRARLSIKADQKTNGLLRVRMTDLGMGDFYPATGISQEEMLDLYAPGGDNGSLTPHVRFAIGNYLEEAYEEPSTHYKAHCLEELSYIIIRNAELLDESLLDDNLPPWVGKLGLGELASGLARSLRSKDLEDFV